MGPDPWHSMSRQEGELERQDAKERQGLLSQTPPNLAFFGVLAVLSLRQSRCHTVQRPPCHATWNVPGGGLKPPPRVST